MFYFRTVLNFPEVLRILNAAILIWLVMVALSVVNSEKNPWKLM